MILHTVNKSPFSNSSFVDCVTRCSSSDSILLIEDGIYAGQRDSVYSNYLTDSDIRYFALQADVQARGLMSKLHQAVTLIDDRAFVDLCTQHKSVQSWY